MATHSGLLLLLSATICLLQLSCCQDLQCSTLNTGYSGEPSAGNALSVCSSTDLQCCQQDYINSVTDLAGNKLRDELRVQLRNTAATFNNTVARIQSYFNTDFVTGFLRIINNTIQIVTTNVDLERAIGGYVNMIPANIVINDNTITFNTTEVVTNIVTSLGNAVALQLATQNRANFTCVLDAIRNNINEMAVAEIIRSIEELRRSFTLLNRVVDYLEDFSNTQFQFPQNCVRRFVELNFCARCRGQTPPLCSNTCGALVRGCLSAHYAALTRQFDILWNVSRQVLNATNNTLHTLFAEERLLVDIASATMQVFQCTSTSGGSDPRGKRQAGGGGGATPPFIPAERMQELARLAGRAFNYDDGSDNPGPVVCRPSRDERSFCGNGSASARSQNCMSNDPCTSSCRCFNGQSEQRMNTQEFDVDGIDGQGDNPAIDLNTDELVEIAQSIGTPVSAFLQQTEVASFIPEGVEVPPGEPFSGGDDSGERMSSQAMISLMVTAAAMAVLIKA